MPHRSRHRYIILYNVIAFGFSLSRGCSVLSVSYLRFLLFTMSTYPPAPSNYDQGYPPAPQPQPGYPPQQQPGYPPQQQPGYPPQQQPGYPPQQQQGYPPQQQPSGHIQDYKGNAPPPYFGSTAAPQQQPAPVIQQSTSNVVVVTSQPTPVVTHTVQRVGDHFLTLSIILTFLCFFCGTWYSLCCTIPAIFLAVAARDAESRGDVESANSKGRIALILNIVALVWWVIALIIIIAIAATRPGQSGQY